MAPSDFFLFPNLKKWLEGKQFYNKCCCRRCRKWLFFRFGKNVFFWWRRVLKNVGTRLRWIIKLKKVFFFARPETFQIALVCIYSFYTRIANAIGLTFETLLDGDPVILFIDHYRLIERKKNRRKLYIIIVLHNVNE